MGFTLRDPLHRLDPEDFRTLGEAVTRAYDEPWSAIDWRVYDPVGRLAASPPRPNIQHSVQ